MLCISYAVTCGLYLSLFCHEATVNAFLAMGRTLSRLLTYDFCPQVNRWVYWMKRPIAILSLAAVAALACAVFVKPLALVAFGAVLLVQKEGQPQFFCSKCGKFFALPVNSFSVKLGAKAKLVVAELSDVLLRGVCHKCQRGAKR